MQLSALSPDFFLDVQPERERVVVRLGGELDLAVAAQVEQTLVELLDAGFARVVVDLRALSFLDTAGIHAFLSVHSSAEGRGGALSLIPAAGDVQRVFELTAAESLLAFDDGPGR